MTESVHPHPATAAGNKAFVVTPFARLARTHAASTMADAMVATAFAGSLFFSLPADDARWPVLRYLIITMLPFSVLSPLIGPLIDRMKGGHRLVVLGSTVVRVALCYLLTSQIKGGSTVFFLLALCLLVCQKAYQVARSALVPTVVRSDDGLVEANSKLSLISGLSGFLGVVPAGILLKVFGPEWSVALAMCTYGVASVLATQIPKARVASEPADQTEREELRSAGIIMAGSAMGLLRACVGFLTLLIAFDFRGGDRPTWQFGVVGAVSVLSQLGGAALAPRIRERTTEENLLSAVLALVVVGGVLSLLVGDVAGASILGGCVGFAAGGGKLAFDSILQRDAPDANRGRAFARFETRFQVTWVIGALIPVWITMHARLGFGLVLALATFASVTYAMGRLAYAHRTGTRQTAATAAATVIEDRLAEVSGEVKGRLASAPKAAYRRLRTGRTIDLDQDDPEAFLPGPVAEDPELGDDPETWPEPEWSDSPTIVVPGGGRDHGRGGQDLGDPRDAHGSTADRSGSRRGRWSRRRRQVRFGPESATIPVSGEQGAFAEVDDHLAAGSPVAWRSDDASRGDVEGDDIGEYPWEPPTEVQDRPGAFLEDVDPSVDNPYPWSPDDES